MEHELIDYYNKNGKYMGTIDKAIAHKKGLWHKSVHIWIINEKSQILLQKRCPIKKFFPNFWDCSASGHIGAGESSVISGIRETYEELGIKLNKSQLNFAFTIKEQLNWDNIKSNEFVDVYIVNKNIDYSQIRLQKEEVSDVKFFNIEDIINNKIKVLPHSSNYWLNIKRIINNVKDYK